MSHQGFLYPAIFRVPIFSMVTVGANIVGPRFLIQKNSSPEVGLQGCIFAHLSDMIRNVHRTHAEKKQQKNTSTLRTLGPSNGGVWTGVRVLKIATFAGSGFLGHLNGFGSNIMIDNTHCQCRSWQAKTGFHVNFPGCIHQGKSTWHRPHVLVYISTVLTYLLGTVPCIFTLREEDILNPKPWRFGSWSSFSKRWSLQVPAVFGGVESTDRSWLSFFLI